MRLGQIAEALGLEVEGDDVEVVGLAGLADAGPDELSFITGPRHRRAFEASRGGAFLVPPDLDTLGRPCLRSLDPYADFARVIELMMPAKRPVPGIHPSAVIAEDAEIGSGVSIGPLVVVGERCRIGDRSVLHAHVTLYSDCSIGADCVIHSGAHLRDGTRLGDRVLIQNGVVVGCDGFGYTNAFSPSRFLVPHVCPVEIGDDVEIGANSTIDSSHPGQERGGFPETRTRLGKGTKLDNLVHVGHGCVVGDNGTLCAQAALAGSTLVGRSVWFGGQSATAGHLEVGDGAMIGARAAPHTDVEPGAQLLGTPAIPRRAWGRFVVSRERIPRLFQRVRAIEKRLGIERNSSAEGGE